MYKATQVMYAYVAWTVFSLHHFLLKLIMILNFVFVVERAMVLLLYFKWEIQEAWGSLRKV